MTQPFGAGKEYFRYSLFLVLCNRMLTVTLALGLLLARLVLLVSAAPITRCLCTALVCISLLSFMQNKLQISLQKVPADIK